MRGGHVLKWLSRLGRARFGSAPRHVALVSGLALALGAPRLAHADPPAIQKNDYNLEFYQGPVIAPIRVAGLAGAYTGYAEGVEGTASNAASPAVREPWTAHWLDVDVAFSVSFPGSFARTDFDNRGPSTTTEASRFGDFLYVNLGAQVQFGQFGTSVVGDLQQFSVTSARADTPGLSMLLGRWHALAAYGLMGDQLILGAGARVLSLQINQSGRLFNGTLLNMVGVGPEIGALYKPNGAQWRIGGTLRAPVSGTSVASDGTTVDENGVLRAGNLVLPQKVVQPWEVELGVALQAGPRPLNPAWINPHEQEAPVRHRIEMDRAEREARYEQELARTPREDYVAKAAELAREEKAIRVVEDQRMEVESERLLAERRARYNNWPREKILLLTSLLITGPSDEGVDVEGFLDQKRERFGRRVSLTPRLGVEAEPIVNWARTRFGTYVEPSRFDTGNARQHFTAGADFKVAPFNLWGLLEDTTWRASFNVDVAPRYSNWGIGIGPWH